MRQRLCDTVVIDRSGHVVGGVQRLVAGVAHRHAYPGGNDVAMLRAAGVGVAMGNACDEALNAAEKP